MIYSERPMTATKPWCDKVCYLCGQYFNAGDQIVLIIPHSTYKERYKKLSRNIVAHAEEFSALKSKCTNEEEVLISLATHRKPKAADLNDNQRMMVKAFDSACFSYGYRICVQTANGMICKRSGASDALEYNARTGHIRYTNRRRKGLFDGLFTQQIVTNVENKMHELLGDGQHNNYDAAKIINDTIQKVDSMIGK